MTSNQGESGYQMMKIIVIAQKRRPYNKYHYKYKNKEHRLK